MTRRAESGFSILEVIAAVAIIAIALIPIMMLQAQLARSQARLGDAHEHSTSVQNALALLRDINPMSTPSGQRRLDGRTALTWSSTPISGLRQTINPTGFEAQLYRVTGTIERDELPSTTLQIELIGWRAATDP
jgi:general secretion pathway protein I